MNILVVVAAALYPLYARLEAEDFPCFHLTLESIKERLLALVNKMG